MNNGCVKLKAKNNTWRSEDLEYKPEDLKLNTKLQQET